MIQRLGISLFMTMIFLFFLGSCSKEPDQEVKNFVQITKTAKAKEVEKLPEFVFVEPYLYKASSIKSPFEPPMIEALKKPVPKKQIGPTPDMNRPRELLESYPLDSLKMVGTLQRANRHWALIKDTHGFVHRVGIGNYLGENFGKIVKIGEKNVEIREWVLDAEGNFKERTVYLQLSK